MQGPTRLPRFPSATCPRTNRSHHWGFLQSTHTATHHDGSHAAHPHMMAEAHRDGGEVLHT
ncbi:hypothetical protein EPI10_024037 [Gossypium australe]|uniref:Uncharacterized protein n=1 Tax=Gossypium australe TaxID=47621 RepID=A0A5B6VXE8_9ROSI|nr:hypothetical protein EPI10_024037 [Gossypium australe]